MPHHWPPGAAHRDECAVEICRGGSQVSLHTSEFPETITQTLMALTGAEDGTLLWFVPDQMPRVAYNLPYRWP